MSYITITGIKTAADVELNILKCTSNCNVTEETDPDLKLIVQYYKHFDLSDEQLGQTGRYNCWGFTFLPRRYWIASDTDVDQILNDNCIPVALGSIRPGDVIRYRDSNNVTTHTGRVWEVDATGNCSKVRSKWGAMGEYIHIPLDPHITPYYGTNLAYFRQIAPLKGIGDLWIRDANDDNGEQYNHSGWSSPDIQVDAPPYGSGSLNPILGQDNHVSVIVHNRSNVDIANARIRYYWVDPNAGFAPSKLNLIPSTAGHPNPTNTFTVPANSSIQAPYVDWIPGCLPAGEDTSHQCLFAIVYVNDDPKDSDNPDPLVYPFDILWDNNIAARNVTVITLTKGSKIKLQLDVGIPFDGIGKLNPDLNIRLETVPSLPILGFPPKVVMPIVQVAFGKQQPFYLSEVKQVEVFDKVWGPSVKPRDIDFELLQSNNKKVFLPAINEKTVAWHQIKNVPLLAEQSNPLQIEITAPEEAQPGTNFYLRTEQVVNGEIKGCYTVVIRIV